MRAEVIGKTIAQGKNRWRLNPDGSWDVLMFGSFPYQTAPGLVWRWVAVKTEQVPKEVKEAAA